MAYMEDTSNWNAEEKEDRLRRLFEMTLDPEEDVEFMTVQFGDKAPDYQLRENIHNITGLDERMAKATEEVMALFERFNSLVRTAL